MRKKDLILQIIKKRKAIFAVLIIFTLVYSLISVIPPKLIGEGVDMLKNGDFATTLQTILIAVGLMALAGIINYIKSVNFINLENDIIFSLRKKILLSIMQLRYKDILDNKNGRLNTCLMDDVNNISSLLGQTSVGVLTESLKVVFLFAVMISTNLELTLLSLVQIIPAAFLLNYFFKKFMSKTGNYKSSLDGAYSLIHQNIDSLKTIKLLAIEKKTYNRSLEVFETVKKNKGDVSKLDAQVLLTYSVFPIVTSIITWGFGGYKVYMGQMSIGDLIAFQMYIQFLISPVLQAFGLNKLISGALIALDRITDLMNKNSSDEGFDFSETEHSLENIHTIDVKDLNFRYDNKEILRNVNLKFNKNDLTAVVGGSGVGKTTLAHMLVKFIDPQDGEVMINGSVNIRDVKNQAIREKICFVDSDIQLVGRSLRQILLLPETGERDDEARDVLNNLGLHYFCPFIGGSENEWQDNYPQISNGELHRVAIARAILKNPDVIIIDEALSSVDILLESKIINYFHKLKGQVMIILITHSQNFIDYFDSVIVFNRNNDTTVVEVKEPTKEKVLAELLL